MKNRKILLTLCFASIMYAQGKHNSNLSFFNLKDVKSSELLPFSLQKISAKDLKKVNYGQSLTSILGNTVSAHSISYDGTAIVPSHFTLRGERSNGINAFINGVRLNSYDSGDIQWRALQDIIPSLDNIVINRGVGPSSNGGYSIGGSINLNIKDPSPEAYVKPHLYYGKTYNYSNYGFQGGTGKFLNDKLSFDFRLSNIKSNGYRYNSNSKFITYDMIGLYKPCSNTTFKLYNLNAIAHANHTSYLDTKELADDPRKNNATESYVLDENKKINKYLGHEDLLSFTTLSWMQDYNHWTTNMTGYLSYSQHLDDKKQNSKHNEVKIPGAKPSMEYINQLYENRIKYGVNFLLSNEKKNNKIKTYLGLNASRSKFDYGLNFVKSLSDDFYPKSPSIVKGESIKSELSSFAKVLVPFNNILEVYGDINYRIVNHKNVNLENENKDIIIDNSKYNKTYRTISPKTGINLKISPKDIVYASYAVAFKEPLQLDIINFIDKKNEPNPEKIHDYELGYKRVGDKLKWGLNLYRMNYTDIILKDVSDTNPKKSPNRGKSLKQGVELYADLDVLKNKLNLFGNLSYNDYRYINYSIGKGNTITEKSENKKKNNDDIMKDTPKLSYLVGLDISPIKNLHLLVSNKFVDNRQVNDYDKNDIVKKYHVTNLTATFSPKFNNKNKLKLSAHVDNVFDKKYVEYGKTDMNGESDYLPASGRNVVFGLSFNL